MKALVIAASILGAVITLLLVKLTVERARLPYENGRHFNARYGVVYDESAVTVYALFALVAGLLTALAVLAAIRLRRH